MNALHLPSIPLSLAGCVLCAGLLATGPASAHAINGAIYTSLAGGETVNANIYDDKADVYLNGGPNNASCTGGEIDAGDYYFQVTDPSGAVLLSSDAIGERGFTVSGGVISAYLGATHTTVANAGPCGGITIELMPYDDTPNNGGVYKVWITRISDFESFCGAGSDCGLGGFVDGHTKTDNFRVASTEPPGPGGEGDTGNLQVFKYFDANANGVFDGTDSPLEGWLMLLDPDPSGGQDNPAATNVAGVVLWTDLELGDYIVTEGVPEQDNWFNSEPGPNPTALRDEFGDPVLVTQMASIVDAGDFPELSFGNYCLVPSGGHTLGFWSNRNGKATLEDGGTLAPELALLSGFNLRNADGSDFDPASYASFRSWLLNATATNMAYMLSAQLAAMVLNLEAGFVDGGAFYVPFGGTIDELVADADAALGADGLTLAGDPTRADQEELKDFLDELNNGAGVIPSDPAACPFTFGDDAFGTPVIESTEAPAE